MVFLIGDITWAESESEPPANKPWFVSAYYGIYTTKTFLRTLLIFPLETEDLYFLGLGVGREVYRWEKHFSLELEGQLAHHFGEHQNVSQNFEEFVAALNLRYRNLPWDKYLPTTFAVGDGLSYTTEKLSGEESRNLLNYLMFEVTASLPQYRAISLVYRVHHRSGIFGALGTGGSNYYTLGLRYSF
jgi:hypothetical protein